MNTSTTDTFVGTRANTSFAVHVTYCDGEEVIRERDTSREAIQEFSQLLQEIFEPTVGHQHAKHVFMAELIAYDQDGAKVMEINSGNFPCEHDNG